MREAYKKALGGLTLLDTLQSHTGMPKVIDHIDSLQNKSVLSYMCMMETIHAKSYSTIFTTVATTPEINEIFNWVQENEEDGNGVEEHAGDQQQQGHRQQDEIGRAHV